MYIFRGYVFTDCVAQSAWTDYGDLGSLGNLEVLLSLTVAAAVAAARFASLHVHALPCLSSLLTVSYIPIYLYIAYMVCVAPVISLSVRLYRLACRLVHCCSGLYV